MIECKNCRSKVRDDLEYCPICHYQLKISEHNNRIDRANNSTEKERTDSTLKDISKQSNILTNQNNDYNKRKTKQELENTRFMEQINKKILEDLGVFPIISESDSKNIVKLTNLADQYEANKEIKKLDNALREILKINPKLVEVWIKLLDITWDYRELGGYPATEKVFFEAIKAVGNNKQAFARIFGFNSQKGAEDVIKNTKNSQMK